MTIKIVTDSTCDLPEAIIARYGIAVVPLYINLGERSYLDGVELSRQEFYVRLSAGASFPTTAAPGPESFRQVYQATATEDVTGILSIHVSGSVSATLNNARLGAQEIKQSPVTVFDSEQLSMGTGFLVLTAAKAAAAGRSMAEIIALLEAQILRTHTFAVLDTLEFLRHSGRVSSIAAGLGAILQIKPVFKMYNGQVTFERVRTRKRAVNRLISLIDDLTPLEQAALLHSNAPNRAEALRRQVQHLLPVEDIPLVDISPIVSAHIGPGAVGIACVRTSQKKQ